MPRPPHENRYENNIPRTRRAHSNYINQGKLDDLNLAIKKADTLLSAIVKMKLHGWLSGDYDLPDQREVIEAAREYNKARGKLRVPYYYEK